MFRTTSNHLVKTVPAWRNASVYSSVKNYTTPATSTPVTDKKQDQEKPLSLSARLGGSGRGKVMSSPDSADPFASFLANARKPRGPNNNNNNNNNERRNGNFTPRPRKEQGNRDGQFADATANTEGGAPNNNNNRSRQPRAPRAEGESSNNNNNNRSRPQRKTNAEGAVAQGDNKDGQARTNNNNRNNNNRNNFNSDGPRKNNRKMNINRSQPQEVRTRRAVTFIDKDIDWASFDTVHTANETAAEEVKEDGELLLKEMQGDYERYLTVGSEITWSQIINGAQVGTLVGSNPTFDLSQKTAFLAAVSKATNGVAARK